MKKISAYWNYLRYGYRNRVIRPNIKYEGHTFSEDNTRIISDFLAESGTDAAVAFVGLRQVKYSLGVDDSFSYLLKLLTQQFSTLIVPTFSPSVLETRVFDVQNTPSENGTFSQIFMKQADVRTICPFKSYAVQGALVHEISALGTLNDYDSDGMFDYINRNNIISLNIGTIDTRPCCIHYVEYKAALSYLLPRWVPVDVYDSDRVKHTNEYLYLDYKIKVKFNRDKIEKDLIRAGIEKKIVINDLVLRLLPEQEYFDYLLSRLKKDPYYLVD